MLNDPDYLEACNAAVYSVFTDTQLDYSPTPERELTCRATPERRGVWMLPVPFLSFLNGEKLRRCWWAEEAYQSLDVLCGCGQEELLAHEH
jgi:hypothetical protein